MTLQRYALAAALAMNALVPLPVFAQSIPMFQTGTATPHHLSKFTTNGLVVDAAKNGLLGDANGHGVSPFSVQDDGADGLCANSTGSGGQYYAFCIGHDTSGNAIMRVDSRGGATQSGFKLIKDGAVFDYSFGPGNLTVPNGPTSGHVICYSSGTLARVDCADTVGGAIIGPSTFISQSPGLNVKPTSANSVGAYFEGYGTAGSPSAYPLYFVLRDYSVSHSARIDIQAVNQAGTVQDSAAFINPGFNWWTTGHEQTDIDFGGCRNGTCGVVLAYLGSGCQSAFNNSIGGPPCPVDLNPGFGPGSDGLLDLGGPSNRFNNAYFVKAQIKPTTNQNLLIAGPLHLATGMSFQTYLDNTNPTQLELSASNIEFYVPSGYTRTKIATDRNLTVQDKLALTTGVSIQSLDDTLAVAKGLEIVGSTIQLTGPVTAPSTPTGTPTASLCLDVSGAIIKKTTAGSCI